MTEDSLQDDVTAEPAQEPKEADRAVLDFLVAYADDLASGRLGGLEDYQRRFAPFGSQVAAAWAELQDPVPADAETVFGPYRLLEQIGRGGQGVVYLAQDTRLERRVALKILSGTGAGLDRFRREAEIASRLDHPGICTVYEAGCIEERPYIAMRRIRGKPLSHVIAETRPEPTEHELLGSTLTPDHSSGPGGDGRTTSRRADASDLRRVVEIVAKAARALHAAHEAGVVHRDVKPGNIMVTEDDQPVILDFGLAAWLDSGGTALTRTGDTMGTPLYMAPEQIEGDRSGIDRRTDVYGLGVTLYHALVGVPPFSAMDGRQRLFHRVLEGRFQPPRAESPVISRDLEAVVLRAMALRRRDRYATALELAHDLENVRDGRATVARPVGVLGRAERWARRHPGTSLAALLVVGALAVATWAVLETDHQSKRVDAADARFEILSTLERLRRRAAAGEPGDPDDQARMRRLIPDEATRELVLADPASADAWDALVALAAENEPRGGAPTRLRSPRASLAGRATFSFETGLSTDRVWHLDLWLVTPEGAERRFPLTQDRGEARVTFPLAEDLAPGAYRWGVEVDAARHPGEAASREEHFARFRVLAPEGRAGPEPTGDDEIDRVIGAARLVTQGRAAEALRSLRGIDSPGRHRFEPLVSYVEARAHALLGRQEEIARLRAAMKEKP